MKNYTSSVPAERSISYIEHQLARHNVLNISKQYDNGKISSIFFQIENNGKVIPFKLPANIEKCYMVLRNQVKRPIEGTEKRLQAQAERTAWKIISDWIDIQFSLIEMEQAEFLQVFLPYIAIGNQTFYEKLKANDFKQIEHKRKT